MVEALRERGVGDSWYRRAGKVLILRWMLRMVEDLVGDGIG